MAAQRSVGRFCSVVVKDLTELSQLSDATLGIGAQAFVLSNSRAYRLSSVVISGLSPVAIAALSGAASWLQEDAVSDQTFYVNSTAQSGDFFASLNTWRALPTGSGLYASSVAKACWAVNTTTGIVTYTGVPAWFVCRAEISVQLFDKRDVWEFELTRNGSLIGTTTNSSTCIQNINDNSIGVVSVTHFSTPFFATPSGTSYQHVTRDISSTVTYELVHYQACFELLP